MIPGTVPVRFFSIYLFVPPLLVLCLCFQNYPSIYRSTTTVVQQYVPGYITIYITSYIRGAWCTLSCTRPNATHSSSGCCGRGDTSPGACNTLPHGPINVNLKHGIISRETAMWYACCTLYVRRMAFVLAILSPLRGRVHSRLLVSGTSITTTGRGFSIFNFKTSKIQPDVPDAVATR